MHALRTPRSRPLRLSLLLGLVAALAVGSVEAGSTGRCGGTGGKFSKTLSCPEGEYVDGIGARAGGFVDQVSIRCRKIPAAGVKQSLGPKQSFKSAGPGGGTSNNSVSCPDGQAVTFIHVYSGAFLDRLGSVGCGQRDGTGWRERASGQQPLNTGGPGGHYCDFDCPAGEALTGITVRYEGWVDSITGQCRR